MNCMSVGNSRGHKMSKVKLTFQWRWHLKPLRQPLATLVDVQTVRIDPPYITGLRSWNKNVRDTHHENVFGHWNTRRCAADLSDLGVAQLVRAQLGQSPVQLEQLQAVAAEPLANQEGRQARRQEEQRADVSLRQDRKQMCSGGGQVQLKEQSVEGFDWPSDPRSSSSHPEALWRTGPGRQESQTLWGSVHFAPESTDTHFIPHWWKHVWKGRFTAFEAEEEGDDNQKLNYVRLRAALKRFL